jgi:hypothetical protein
MNFWDWLKKLLEDFNKPKPPVGPPIVEPKPPIPPPITEPEPQEPKLIIEDGSYSGRLFGDRPTWYFGLPYNKYPKWFYLTIPGFCNHQRIVHNNKAYNKDGLLIEQSEGRKVMAILIPSKYNTTKAQIKYPADELPSDEQLPPPSTTVETKFHHTQTDGPDGGKSLVLCPGQRMNFDKCVCNGVTIPRHKDGDGRETYWNMRQAPKGDIVCTKDGKEYIYPATRTDSRGFVWGSCSGKTNK